MGERPKLSVSVSSRRCWVISASAMTSSLQSTSGTKIGLWLRSICRLLHYTGLPIDGQAHSCLAASRRHFSRLPRNHSEQPNRRLDCPHVGSPSVADDLRKPAGARRGICNDCGFQRIASQQHQARAIRANSAAPVVIGNVCGMAENSGLSSRQLAAIAGSVKAV